MVARLLALALLLALTVPLKGQVAVFGNLVPCTTCLIPQPMQAATGASSSVTQTSFDIAGTCDPNGTNAGGAFVLSPDPILTDTDTFSTLVLVGSGFDPVAITGGSFTGLQCDTAYYTAALCYDGANIIVGNTVTVTTSACTPPPSPAPVVVTSAATNVSTTAALLNGTVDPEGTTATGQFRCGTSSGNYTGCGNTSSPTTAVSVGAGTSPVAISATVSGLLPSTTYYFAARGTSAAGTTDGSELTLTTSAASGTQTLLDATTDFTLDGSWDLEIAGNDNQQGLAFRMVSGLPRLLVCRGTNVREIVLNGVAFNTTITSAFRTWTGIGGMTPFVAGASNKDHMGCFWDEANSRLWTTAAASYAPPLDGTHIYTRTLNDNETVSNIQGPYLLQGIQERHTYGGVAAVPSSKQTAYGIAPFVIGWGGGTSTMSSQGGSCSGLCLYTMPEPSGLTPGVATSSFHTLAKHVFVADDNCAPATCNRTYRTSAVENFHDGQNDRRSTQDGSANASIVVNVSGTAVTRVSGVSFPYGTSTGTLAPSWWIGATARINGQVVTITGMSSSNAMTIGTNLGTLNSVTMISPSDRPWYTPVGTEWTTVGGNTVWSMYDSYWNGCVWIDKGASAKHGFVCAANLESGKAWYWASDIYRDNRTSEWHVYDPAHFNEAKTGARSVWNVQPSSMAVISTPGVGKQFSGGLTWRQGIGSLTYDSVNDKLYAMACQPDTNPAPGRCRIYRYSVGD